MTALERYARLEAIGRYHESRAPRPREVVVSFGARSLIIIGLDDEPIAHWPLASLRAPGAPGALPLEIAPEGVGDERLVLEDREMSAAIAEICPELHTAPPRPPRRRRWRRITAIALPVALVAGALALWPVLPHSLADLMPGARAAMLGERIAVRLPALIRPEAPPAICIETVGTEALGALARRLGAASPPGRPPVLAVLDDPRRDVLALPGGRVLLFRGLLRSARTPEALAGIIAHAIGHADARAPLQAILDRVSLGVLTGLLVGDLTRDDIDAAAAAVLATRYAPEAETQADTAAFALLSRAGLPTLPYAGLAARLAAGDAPADYSGRHPWTQARAAAAAAADMIGSAPFEPALSDRDWIALGAICNRTRPATAEPEF